MSSNSNLNNGQVVLQLPIYSLLPKTNIAKPAKSLVKSICYPEAHNFSTAATRWSSEHEVRARRAYHIEINGFHESLTISDSGLNIDPRWPYLVASPDGIVDCKYWGMGVLYVK